MAKADLPPVDVLRQLLRYDPETGKLYWRERGPEWFTPTRFSLETRAKQWNALFAGKEAMAGLCSHGYPNGALLGVNYRAHTVIWALVYGTPPLGEIDHIDGNRTNNRLTNLRDVTRSANTRNKGRRRDNVSGVTGVWRVGGGKWQACLYANRQRINLGRYSTKEAAVAARKAAETQYGFSARHGK